MGSSVHESHGGIPSIGKNWQDRIRMYKNNDVTSCLVASCDGGKEKRNHVRVLGSGEVGG